MDSFAVRHFKSSIKSTVFLTISSPSNPRRTKDDTRKMSESPCLPEQYERRPVLSESKKSPPRTTQKRRIPICCVPCRKRKVRCDKKRPCSTCKTREQPDLCHYDSRIRSTPATSASSKPRATGRSSRIPPQPAIPQEALGSVQPALETAILSLLGAAGSRDTPGASFRSLPNDQEIVCLFEVYRDRVHPFHGITYNLEVIERTTRMFMHSRSEIGVEYHPAELRDYRLLGLLHVILASGAQFSDLPIQTCISLSQKHGT